MPKIETSKKIIQTLKNWPLYFFDFFGALKNKIVIYKLRNGLRFLCRAGTNDSGALFEIWIHQFYLPENFKINDGDIIIDIGAHIGLFSIYSAFYDKRGIIYSFEPVPENFALFEKNEKINNISNIVKIKKAVAGDDGGKKIYLSKDTGAHSIYKNYNEVRNNELNAAAVSLNTFFKENNIKKVDLLKIDCEGGEYEILYGCADSTLAMIKKITMEYHQIDNKLNNAEHLKLFLEEKGFTVIIRHDRANMLYAFK